MQTNLITGTISANYNNGRYFKDCLKGILSQTVKPTYMVVIDDHSTDNSIDLILEGVRNYTNDIQTNNGVTSAKIQGIEFVLFKRGKNGGPAAARNVGLDYLVDRAHVVFVADIDDIYYPLKIQRSLEAFGVSPHIGLVYSDYDTLNIKTNEIKREFKEPFSYKRLVEECIVSNNSAIATSVIKMIGKYDEALFGPEDYDMWLRIAEVALVYHIPEALYQYRITGDNITLTTPSNKFAAHVHRVKQKILERNNARLY